MMHSDSFRTKIHRMNRSWFVFLLCFRLTIFSVLLSWVFRVWIKAHDTCTYLITNSFLNTPKTTLFHYTPTSVLMRGNKYEFIEIHFIDGFCHVLRGHRKMSTFSLVYKQYIFSDPLPPPLQVYRPTFLVSKIWVSCITFIVQQQKLTLILSLFDM